jgi:hypothetical protein
MTPQKLTMGKGSVVTCLARLLHPSQLIRDCFPNMNRNKRLDNMIVIRQETKKILRKEHKCIVVQSNDVMEGDVYLELYAAVKHFKVTVEGLAEDFFTDAVEEAAVNDDEQPRAIADLLPNEVID